MFLQSEYRKFHSVNKAQENVKLLHDCCAQHERMRTARMKEDKETEEEDEQKIVNICEEAK